MESYLDILLYILYITLYNNLLLLLFFFVDVDTDVETSTDNASTYDLL